MMKCRIGQHLELVWNNYTSCFYVLDASSQSVGVIGGGDQSDMAIAIQHVAREWTTEWIDRTTGWSCVHASAVARNGRGLLFIGGKRAGKTSTAFAFIEYGRYEFVANDRVFVRKQTGWEIIGLSYWLNIRPDTLEHFPSLRTITELDRSEEQVLSAFGTSRRSTTALSSMFFVGFDSDIAESSLERLSPEDAREELRSNLLVRRQPSFLSGMFLGSNGMLSVGGETLDPLNDVESLVDEVPAYRIRQSICNLISTVLLVEHLHRSPRP